MTLDGYNLAKKLWGNMDIYLSIAMYLLKIQIRDGKSIQLMFNFKTIIIV